MPMWSGMQLPVASGQLPVNPAANHSGSDCSCCNGVGAVVAVAFFKFFAGAEGFDIDDSVYREDAIEMVDLMLQQFGKIAAVPGAEHMLHALQVPVADGDFAMALDLHENREKAKAGIPDDNLFCAAFDDFRVDERTR